MGEVPSPQEVMRQLARSREAPLPGRALLELRARFPHLLTELPRFGLVVDEEIEEWETQAGTVAVRDLVSAESSRFQIAAAIRDVAATRGLPLLPYLVAEDLLGRRSADVAGYLRSAGTSLEAVLSKLYERLGEAFLDAAFSATWQRRAVFARTLDSARAYLQWTRQSEVLRGHEPRRGIQTRIGITTVLAARFGSVSARDLGEARAILLDSHHRGAENALAYFIEASTWLFDLYGDVDAIRDAAKQIPSGNVPDSSQSLALAHLWLRLAGVGSRPHGVRGFLTLGREALSRYQQRSSSPEDAAVLLLSATFDELEQAMLAGEPDLSTRGILFPFGHRRPDTPIASLFGRILPKLIEALEGSSRAGDFVFRDLTAEFYSLLARMNTTPPQVAIRYLQAAISLREGGNRIRPITRVGIEVDLAEDRFALAALTGRDTIRRQGFVELLRGAEPEDLRPRYLTMIAREVEERGPLPGALIPGPPDLAIAIRTGEESVLFEAAAHSAYRSADLTQVLLGGRGGVVTLRDSDGVAGQTFVYKQTRTEARTRDKMYSQAVVRELDRRGLTSRFGLIEHLTEIPSVDEGSVDPDSVVSVRRYADGVPLREHLRAQATPNTLSTLANVAEFLAVIHFAGLDSLETLQVRRSLWSSELGRWLRALKVSDRERGELFAEWWEIAQSAPLVPKRDAHPLNWIIGTDDKIRAVDLESKGSRPFAYELAQLVEDGQVLVASNYESRREIVQRYATSWATLTETEIDLDRAQVFYDAGALARAVRAISAPGGSPESRAYGGAVLVSLASNTPDKPLRRIASRVAQHWHRVTGHVGEHSFQRLSESDRRRISRAMAYHLRHDSDAPATRSGWVHVDELADMLRANGHKVSSEQLLLIAGALGEPRFELEGEDVRAAYGHSTRTEIAYESRRPPEYLFHATPTRNLASIFEARAGLRPGQRNWVHMTESCALAVNAARRQQSTVSVLEIDARSVKDLVHASGSTWLAPQVEIERLRILPIRRVRTLTEASGDGHLDPDSA